MPGLIVASYLITLLVAVPLAAAMSVALQDQLSRTIALAPPVRQVPIEWWENMVSDSSLMSTFAPAIVGFAAPLENISALFDRRGRPPVIVLSVVLYATLWAVLWGGILERVAGGSGRSLLRAGLAHAASMLRLTLAAAVAYLLVFAALHPLLFGVLYTSLVGDAPNGRTAFLLRAVLYLVFGLILAAMSVLVDYARVRAIVDNRRHFWDAVTAAFAFVRTMPLAVVTLYVLTIFLFAGVWSAYWAFERVTRGVPNPVNAILVGQAYIVARLSVRLIGAAAEVRLLQRIT